MSSQNFNNNSNGTQVNRSNEFILNFTVDIVSSYVSRNDVGPSELPSLIQSVYQSLISLGDKKKVLGVRPEPAVPIKNSITDDYIVCLEDGRKLKMLKRHLKTMYDMTPDDYRERWNLSAEYPMVAPAYADKRSKLAKAIRLGRSRRPRDAQNASEISS